MQENEKVADIWKRMKQQCEVSDVLVLNQNGEISCYYVDENYPQYLAGFIRINTSGALITMETENYQIDGKKGNWIATDTIIIDVLLVFPTNHKKNSTVRILKTPKTESSVTYKLKLNGGDIKAVQGDSGHA